MYKKLYTFCSNNNITCKLQFRFRQQHSAYHFLININKNIRIHCRIFVDLQKAFDTADQHIPL